MEDPELDADLRRRMAGDLPPRARASEEQHELSAQVHRARSRRGTARSAWTAFAIALAVALVVGVIALG